MSIVITDLCKSFGGTPVLQRFTWTVNRPMVLMGRSGCGKTTLLRILLGLESADSSPSRMRSSVVLPQPERPISTMGRFTVQVKRCKTGVPPKLLQRSVITMLTRAPPRKDVSWPCAAGPPLPRTAPLTAAR